MLTYSKVLNNWTIRIKNTTKVGDHATSLPSTVTYGNYVNGNYVNGNYVVGENIKYSYDSMGNIVKVFENGVLTTRYEYDTLSRLTR